MNDVYLRKLKISGFRSYKSETEVTFPAGPGLTVIVGPNGLGKSTLFDAIEWGLTGELRRLNGMDAKPAEKKDALGINPDVQLWFSDAAHIYRSLTTGTINNVGATKIEDWLTAENWRGVNSIADCLQLTHFLGQSSRQMFVHLDGKQRWGLLEGPAGLQSLWKVQSTLGRKQTSIAFDRVREDFEHDKTRLEDELSLIKDLQEKLSSIRGLESADKILGPEEILSRAQYIIDELENEIGTIASSTVNFEIQGNDVEGILQHIRMNIEVAQQNLASQRAQLSEWSGLVQKYADSIAKQGYLRQDKDLVTSEFEIAETSASKAEIIAASIRENHQILVDENLELQAARNIVVKEIEWLHQISFTKVRLETAKRLSIDLNEQYSEQTESLANYQALLESLELQLSQKIAFTEKISSIKASISQAERLLNEDATRCAARIELVSLPEAQTTLTKSIDEERQVLVGLEIEENNLKLKKDALLVVSNTISAGVAQISSTLREEDCVCPVCKTTFAVAGQLKKLAAQQAYEANQRLAEIEERISLHSEKIQAAKKKIFELNVNVIELKERYDNLTKLVLEADQLEETLRRIPILSDLGIEDFVPALTTSFLKYQDVLDELTASISLRPEVGVVRADIQKLNNVRKDTILEQEKADADVANLESELRVLNDFPATGKTTEQLQVSVREYDLALLKNSESLLELQENLEANNANKAALITVMNEKKKKLFEIDVEISAHRQTEKSLIERWNKMGYEGLPMLATLQRIDELHVDRNICLQRISQEHSTLLEGRRRYLEHVDIQKIEASLNAQCMKYDVQDIDSAIVKINNELIAIRIKQESLLTVQKKRSALLSQLKIKAEDIRSSVSEPLNANTEKFCAALMSDRNYGVNLSAVASATTAQALLSFQSDVNGEAKNPLLYMSEGQLAATSLCLLFGASTTYPWSRWKGLLMDDPLHHNDSIHAAAFIDVVRNLIISRGYQIIVSTHDIDQAGYFLRKCRNAGIIARYIHLYGRAEDGTALLQSD